MLRQLLLAVVLVLALPAAGGCTEKRYHWDDVPYCAVEDGTSGGRFETPLRVITKFDGGGGVSTLQGMRPSRDVAFDSEALVAVVACTSPELTFETEQVAEVLAGFDESTVPEVCAGQRVVLAPTRVTAEATTTPGYEGALPFPQVPEAELRCTAGAAARGSGAP